MTEEPLSCGELLRRLGDRYKARANGSLREKGVTLSQLNILLYLGGKGNGSATLKELERAFGVSQATIAGISARLESKSLVEGYPDPGDRRVKHIRLLRGGRALCRRAEAAMEEAEAWLLEPLEEAERQTLLRLLEKLYRRRRQGGAPAGI